MPTHQYGLIVCVVFGGLAAPEALWAQDPIRIDDRVSCSECQVSVTRVRTLGDADGPGIVGEPTSVVQNSRGWYLVSHLTGWNWFSVFDREGRFLRRVGRGGEGPGEFSFIRMLRIGPTDSVLAIDNALRRLTKFSPDLQVAEVVPFPGEPFDLEPLPDGRMITNTDLQTADAAGFPLHFLDGRGQVKRSFGSDRPAYRRDMPGLTRRSLAIRSDGSFWAVHFSEYVIELWGTDGLLQRRWTREADWFQPHSGRTAVQADEAPRPIVVDVREDAQGLLWVLLWVADPEWKSAVSIRGYVQGQPRYTTSSADEYLDTLIEIVDPQQNRLLLSQRVPTTLISFVGSNEAVSYRETESSAFIDVWRLSLETPTRRN